MLLRPAALAFLVTAGALATSPRLLAADTPTAATVAAKPAAKAQAFPEFGSTPPELKPSAWLQGEPVKALAGDNLYIIACWSSVNLPSAKSVPILNDIHRRHVAKGVVVIGVSVWEESASRVSEFIRGRGDALAFRVAFDGRNDGGTVSKKWLEAADLNGIPYVFAVKNNRVLWHGLPDELEDKSIGTMLAGTYDIAKAAAERVAEQEARVKAEPIASAIEDLLADKRCDEALVKCDELEKTLPPRDRPMANLMRAEALFEKGDFKKGFAQTALYVDAHRNEPEVLAMTALAISSEPRFEGNRDLKLALRCIDRALEIAPIDQYRMLKARVTYASGDYKTTEGILDGLKESGHTTLREHLKLIRVAVDARQPWPITSSQDCACGAH
jgi:hypothetical protein